MKTSVKLPFKYTIQNIHEILCQKVESGYDIETNGTSVLCRVTMKSLKILRLYEFWDQITVKEDRRGELWFEIPFANNKKTYMYNRMKQYEVFADNVEDFLLTYGKNERYKTLWEKHPNVKDSQIRKREDDLRKIGYTSLSKVDGISDDKPLAYFGRKKPEEKENEKQNK